MATNTMNPQPGQMHSSSPQSMGSSSSSMGSGSSMSSSGNRSMRERTGSMFSDGREQARAHPYAAAAIGAGVAAAAIYGGAKLAQSYSSNRDHPRAADGTFKKS